MGSYFGDQSSNRNMRNNNSNSNSNSNSNERSGNSSITSNSQAKKGKNNSNNNTSNNNNNNNNNGEKPKQPQRGLGVAQLEKIRLHTQMANCGLIPHHQIPHPFLNSSFQLPEDMMRFQVSYHQGLQPPPPPPPPYCYASPSVPPSAYGHGYHHPNAFMMGMGDHMERTGNIRFTESQSCNTARWNPNSNARVSRESQPYTPQPAGMVTRHLLSHVEQQNRENNSIESIESSSQNTDESNENEELDLELKL
ncbi:protein SPEAR3-like [Spinacia oleracea]|uniref:Protein SPEAR3-like n=1 Tax=Spinacia oleracea TaxID=3562 RepID=A0A9R0JG36_SPIOL|nr:protein SPEAR3-like [Spinacia oleracea]